MKRRKDSSSCRLNRREFVGLVSGAVGTVLSVDPARAVPFGAELPTHVFRVRRDIDLLALEFSFVNFERRGDFLQAIGLGRSLVIVRFPPQNLAEARFDKSARLETEPQDSDPPDFERPLPENAPEFEVEPIPLAEEGGQIAHSPIAPIDSYLSGPSWIVFSVPDGISVPLNLAAAYRGTARCERPPIDARSVIDVWLGMMGDWPIRVPANAVEPGTPRPPASDETCLEIPFRLFIAPRTETAKWITSSTPPLSLDYSRSSAVELWHAALHDRAKLSPAAPPPDITNLPPELAPPKQVTSQARAVYSPDYGGPDNPPPFKLFYPGHLPLSNRARVRHDLVSQMAEGDGWIDAEHLVLSSLGADASLAYFMQTTFREIHDAQIRGEGPDTRKGRLAIWKHRMVVGRDTFLLSVWTGFLMPFVYPSLLVEMTRRTFASRRTGGDSFGPPGAYLLTEYFILVQDPVKQFSDSGNVVGRKMPFKKATVLDARSPLIQQPDLDVPFVPLQLSTGAPVRWSIEFEDESGRRSKTEDAALLFSTDVVKGHEAWNRQPQEISKWSLPAQRVGLAPDSPSLVTRDAEGSVTSHRLSRDERRPASELAAAFRAVLAQANSDPASVREQLQRISGLSNELPEAARRAASNLSPETRLAIQNLARAGDDADKVVEDVLLQLGRAEEAATDVEVHAVNFASRRVDGLLNQAGVKMRQLLGEAANVDAFKASLDQLSLGPEEVLRLRGEFDALWASATPVAWAKQRRDAERFIRELESEAAAAKAFLRHGFQPQLSAADVVVPALKAMGGATGPQELRLFESYAAKGIDEVRNGAFGEFVKAVDDGKAMAERIKCAVASPSAQVAGLSRDLGALVGSGPSAIADLALKEEHDVSDAIPDFKILGVLPLDQIVSAALSSGELPSINVVTLPEYVEQIWEWNAKLKETDLGIVRFLPDPPVGQRQGGEPVHLYVKMTTRIDVPRPGASVSPQSGRVRLEGVIAHWNRVAKAPIRPTEFDQKYAFSLRLLELIDIRFLDLTFEAEYRLDESPKPKVKPRLGEVLFLPPLDFVKKLQELLPFLGKGFDVIQAPGRIGISYEFQMPAIAFGAFSLRNLAIGSGVLFSLEGKPLRFDFNFSSWKEPFELTVMCFGGRGFMKIAADTSGYRDLQGMIEFGGALAFDVTVASGCLYVMAGIYFRITPEATTVAGFVRAGGNLNVLGLINASVEFLLMLSYVDSESGSKLAGEASVTVSIDLFLVSFDVSVRMYKEFVGSGGGNEENASRLNGTGTQFVSLLRDEQVASNFRPPLAYFDRRPASGGATVSGRFSADVRSWDRQYWSQFAS